MRSGSPSRDEPVAQAAGAPEAERVPAADRLQGQPWRTAQHENLIVRWALRGSSGGGEDPIGVGAVGDNGGHLLQADATGVVALDRADAGADIAADPDFRRRRGQQELAPDHIAQVVPEEGRPAVAHQAGHLDLMHGVHHGGGCAVLPELEHDVGHVSYRGTRVHRAPRGSRRRAVTPPAVLRLPLREIARSGPHRRPQVRRSSHPIRAARRDRS